VAAGKPVYQMEFANFRKEVDFFTKVGLAIRDDSVEGLDSRPASIVEMLALG
jgi:hypothetical protein